MAQPHLFHWYINQLRLNGLEQKLPHVDPPDSNFLTRPTLEENLRDAILLGKDLFFHNRMNPEGIFYFKIASYANQEQRIYNFEIALIKQDSYQEVHIFQSLFF